MYRTKVESKAKKRKKKKKIIQLKKWAVQMKISDVYGYTQFKAIPGNFTNMSAGVPGRTFEKK